MKSFQAHNYYVREEMRYKTKTKKISWQGLRAITKVLKYRYQKKKPFSLLICLNSSTTITNVLMNNFY